MARKRKPASLSRGTISSRWLRPRTSSATLPCGCFRLRARAMISSTRCASRTRSGGTNAWIWTAAPGRRGLLRDRGGERHCAARQVLTRGQHAREDVVHPLDQAGLRAEVDRQGQRLERARCPARHARRAGTTPPPPRGSDRSTAWDRRPRTPCAHRRAASRGEPQQQLELALRSVLELVDQQMLDAIVQRQRQIGRRVRFAQRLDRSQGERDEVHRAAAAERQVELRHRNPAAARSAPR